VRGSIATIARIAQDEKIQPPALLIVGEVASLAKADNEVLAAVDAASARVTA
jgi:siroheme synthase